MIGKITRVKLREVWKHEALDFTKWLENNIDVLGESLGLSLVNAEREKNVGDFSVDLVAEDETGNLVVIENQLEKSNHDHLGKLITYLTALEAKMAVWLVSDPRPEHVRAVAWLNESRAAAFFLAKVEAIKIGDSPPAPLLTLITGPSDELIEVGATKVGLAERDILRKKFWSSLLNLAKSKTKLHAAINPNRYNWIGTSAGVQGLSLNYVVRKHDAQIELYIDQDKESGARNREILKKLESKKQEIENSFGEHLEWEFLDGKRACRIKYVVSIAGWRDEEKWQEAQEHLVDTMIRFEKALRPFLKGFD